MTGFSVAHLHEILQRRASTDSIQIFAETGTFYGDRAAMARTVFPRVYTVELSQVLWATAKHTHDNDGIVFEQGDSRVVVPRWAVEFQEPVFWYLDAHWFDLNARRTKAGAREAAKAQVAGKKEGLPLWAELEAIAQRPYLDVIAVDDVRDFGTVAPTREWLEISLEKIANYFPSHREAVILHDQAVIYR